MSTIHQIGGRCPKGSCADRRLGTTRQFTLFPQLPTELRLKIWDDAAETFTGGPRIIEMFWLDPESVLANPDRRPEDGARLIMVNKESREQYLRSYKWLPRLNYPAQAGDAERYTTFFTHPGYLNPKSDTLFANDTLAARNVLLLDQISETCNLEELHSLACRVHSSALVYNVKSLARFPKLRKFIVSVLDPQFHERVKGRSVSLVKAATEQSPLSLWEISGIVQTMAKTYKNASPTRLPPFEEKEVSRETGNLFSEEVLDKYWWTEWTSQL